MHFIIKLQFKLILFFVFDFGWFILFLLQLFIFFLNMVLFGLKLLILLVKFFIVFFVLLYHFLLLFYHLGGVHHRGNISPLVFKISFQNFCP